MSTFSLHKLPFWFHSLIELIPSIVFVLNPQSQLYGSNITSDSESIGSECCNRTETPKPGAEAIVRQYGVLLFVSVLISTVFTTRQVDRTSRQVAAALTLYHLAPIARATLRLWSGETAWLPKDMGGPWVHLAVHAICFLALGTVAFGAIRDQSGMKAPSKCD